MRSSSTDLFGLVGTLLICLAGAVDPDFRPESCQKPDHVPYQPSWTAADMEIGYRAPFLGLPQRCDGHAPIAEHMIVAAGPRESTDPPWMSTTLKVPYILYEADNLGSLHNHWNVGLEAYRLVAAGSQSQGNGLAIPTLIDMAMAYLRFISEYYDCLPEITLFAHAHRRQSWHRNETLDELVSKLRWERLPGFQYLQPQNNVSVTYLRNVTQNLAGKPIPFWDEPKCDWVVNGTLYYSREVQEFDNGQYIARVWDNFLGPQGFGPVPVKVLLPLGAEFLVRRGRILARPRRFYLDALAFLTEFKKDGVMSGFELAISFERVWHIIFGEEPTAGPALTLCQLYRCPQRQVNNTLLTEIKVKHLHQS